VAAGDLELLLQALIQPKAGRSPSRTLIAAPNDTLAPITESVAVPVTAIDTDDTLCLGLAE
jgi:hypothetical protein